MKITCPKCNASGNIPDHEIPEEGRFLSCPRCKNGFDVKKPKATNSEYQVDVCPACAYSTFGDERFSACPKCGVDVKTFISRQREEMAKAREKEILNRKFTRDVSPSSVPSTPLPSSLVASEPVSESKSIDINEMIENMHPVNLIGWGSAVAALIIVVMGLSGLLDYYGEDIRAKLTEQREEQVSAWYVFLHYGLKPWLNLLYGGALLAVSSLFLQRKAQGRQALVWLLWGAIGYFPVVMTIKFITWWLAPIPHTWTGYLIEIFNILFMTALVGIPLFILIRYLEDRRITTVVRL
jgi:predicted Zn finger-like uncharacterized protein